ncbi:hypothetical protein NFI96_018007 [Prochilodus magdalenae]|nr:hypothetical protein NFI96_018007 [Prochilodus magdalenae]
MAERKNSASPSTHSKGGAVVFAKNVQRKFSRAQEKCRYFSCWRNVSRTETFWARCFTTLQVLQKFGKSEETRDDQFEICAQNLQDQQCDGHRIYKDLKAYLNAVKVTNRQTSRNCNVCSTVMRDASSRLFQSLFDAYEFEWEGEEDLGACVEGEDLLWNDYETKLRDQALITMESYMNQFPDMRERVAKRGRKLVDYDSSRHHLESLENAKKRDDIKISKAKEEMKIAQQIFEEINRELKEELPVLYDSRIGCYVTVFQSVSNLRDTFYSEMAQNNQNLQNIMKDLKAQHPDKNFVIKTFSRCVPSHLNTVFNLLREYSSSFRSDRSSYEHYSKETSPTKPKSTEGSKHGSRDTDTSSMCEDNSTVEVTSPTAPVTDDSTPSATKKEVKPENKEEETEEEKPLPITNQDGGRESPNPKGDSSLQDNNENVVKPSESYSEGADLKASSTPEPPEDHTTHTEVLNKSDSDGMENGITSDHKADTEASGASYKVCTCTSKPYVAPNSGN